MHRIVPALLLVLMLAATGCTFEPGGALSRPVDVRVDRAFVLDDPCSAAAAHEACHVLEATVHNRLEENVSLTTDRWEASTTRHYAARDEPAWVRPVAVEGAPWVAPNQTVDVVLRFDADPEVRFDILRFHHEGPGSNVTGFVPTYKTPPASSAEGNGTIGWAER